MAFLIFVWSLNYIVAKIGLRELPALALGSFRLVTAGIVSLPMLFLLKKEKGVEGKVTLEVREDRPTWLAQLSTITYLGFFGVVLNQGFYTVGLNYTSVSHSALIIACAPIFILLFSWALGIEPLTPRKITGITLAFMGTAAVGVEQTGGTSAHFAGDLLTILAGIGLAFYTVLGKRPVAEYGALRLGLLTNIAGAVLVLPVAAWQIVALVQAGRLGAIGVAGWGSLLYMGVLASAVCY